MATLGFNYTLGFSRTGFSILIDFISNHIVVIITIGQIAVIIDHRQIVIRGILLAGWNSTGTIIEATTTRITTANWIIADFDISSDHYSLLTDWTNFVNWTTIVIGSPNFSFIRTLETVNSITAWVIKTGFANSANTFPAG